MDPEPNPIQSVLDQITDKLESANLVFGQGATDASSEAIWILSHCLKTSPIQLIEDLDDVCPDGLIQQAIQITDERINSRQPLGYILGECWLMGVPFYSDNRSIIPRSFIAELINDGSLDPWLPAGGKALDLCTGNGSLAILLALNCPDIEVSASDISFPALALAAKNLDRHQLTERIQVYQGDLWDPLPEPNEENLFDLIICNPPYVNANSMSNLPSEFLCEPQLALSGGQDGMDLIRKIIFGAKQFLTERGALVIEIGNEFNNFCAAFPDIPTQWLEVSAGDQQVLLIEAENLP